MPWDFPVALPTTHGCRAWNSATQSIGSGSTVNITFDTNIFDTDGYHSTSVNTSRITIPSGLGGFYTFVATIAMPVAAINNCAMFFSKNGTVISDGGRFQTTGASSSPTVNGVFQWNAVAGDFFEVGLFQDSGGSLNSQTNGSSSAPRNPSFSCMLTP